MRRRQFVAITILVAFMLLMCTACHNADDVVKQASDAANVSGPADGTGAVDSVGDENKETMDQLDANEPSAEQVVQERYEAVPVELFALRFVGKTSEDIAWQEARVITSYTELEAFRRQLTGLWTGAESEKRIEQFRSIVDSYHEGTFEKKALIGVFIQQDNWDYDHEVKLVRDNELNKLELKVTAARPEEVDFQRESAWLLLMEVDRAAVKDITETTVTVENIVDAGRTVIWSDVVTIPSGGLDSSEPVMIESPEELQALIESSGAADTMDWRVLMRNYLNVPSRQEENVILAVSASAPGNTTEYDARAVLDKDKGELTLDVFYCMREDAVVFGYDSRLILIEVKRSDLEKAKEIRRDAIGISYHKEDLIAWGLPHGIDDEYMSMQEADLDHDGEKEQIRLYYTVEDVAYGNKQGRVSLVVFKNEKQLWSDVLVIKLQDKYAKTYYLCYRDGKDYLLFCNENRYDYGEYSNGFELYYFDEEGFLEREDMDSIWIRFDQYRMEHFPVSANELEEYAEHIDGLLANSIYICRVENGTASWAPPKATRGEEPYYEEDFALLFLDETVEAGGKTLGEKTAAFNQTLAEEWFVDGVVPEMSEEFKALMADLMEAVRPNMQAFPAMVEADRSQWFADYNGEKLQIVDPEEEYEAAWPLIYPGKIYYRAENGEAPEAVAEYMLEAMLKHLKEKSQNQATVITDYRIEKPELTSWEDIVGGYTEGRWVEYLQAYRTVGDNLDEYAKNWVEEKLMKQPVSWAIGLQEDMWYFYLDGYYRYEDADAAFAERARQTGLYDGMVSFYWGDGMYAGMFFVVKQGDVYCLQRATGWGQ